MQDDTDGAVRPSGLVVPPRRQRQGGGARGALPGGAPRRAAGGEAVLLLSVDTPVPDAVLDQLARLPGVKRVKALRFP